MGRGERESRTRAASSRKEKQQTPERRVSARTAAADAASSATYAGRYAGRRIQVYSEDDEAWNAGTVTKRDGEHVQVRYDDGDEEWVALGKGSGTVWAWEEESDEGEKPSRKREHDKRTSTRGSKRATVGRAPAVERGRRGGGSSDADGAAGEKAELPEAPEDAVGRRLRVWWKNDKKWYAGEVASVVPPTNGGGGTRWNIVYDDGDEVEEELAKETFEWLSTRRSARTVGRPRKKLKEDESESSSESDEDGAAGDRGAARATRAANSSGDEGDGDSDGDSGSGSGSEEEEEEEEEEEDDRAVDTILACRHRKDPAVDAAAASGSRRKSLSPVKKGADKAAASKASEVNASAWAVGRLVRVWWSGDAAWYTGTVTAADSESGEVTLEYADDGLKQTIVLYREKYVWLDAKRKEDKAALEEWEYFVKWKDEAHMHCEWVSEAALLKLARIKLLNFHERHGWHVQCSLMDPQWTEAQRVIAAQREYVLVKWIGLSYEHCTWEVEATMAARAPEAVAAFRAREKAAASAAPGAGPKRATRAAVPRGQRLAMLTEQPPLLAGGQLFPHQMEALNWLRMRWHSRMNVILADEMGLGKTVSTIAFLHQLIQENGSRAPSLVVVPLSTLPNWMAEFSLWAPHLNVVEYHGSKDSRLMVRQNEFYAATAKAKGGAGARKKRALKFHVMVTTYECALTDADKLKNLLWEAVVVDEGHRLKSSGSKLYASLKAYDTGWRMLLTGTPLQNNLNELFNLMTFLEGERFPSLEEFQEEVEGLDRAGQVERLKELVAPRLLRRVKSEVMKRIPPREERVVPVELTPVQLRYYRALLTRNYEVLKKSSSSGAVQSLLNIVMQLRKCCNHPFLLEQDGPEESQKEEERQGELVAAAGKLSLLHKLLTRLRADGHRVLVFSQMTRMLDLLEESVALAFGDDAYERIDGNTVVRERQKAIARFNEEGSSSFIFLLSTRACGLGINLATADTVVIYDSDWNPHNDIQAINRAHRIGQSKRLLVYRLTTRATVEERILNLAKKKLLLESLFVQGTEVGGSGKGDTRKEMTDILWWGVDEIFEEDEVPGAGRGDGAGTDAAGAADRDRREEPSTAAAKKKADAKRSKMVWDDAKLAKLLDRTPPPEVAARLANAEADGGTDNDGLLGSINVWDLREGQEVRPLREDLEDEEEEEAEGGGAGPARDWDPLLKHHYEEERASQQAKLGVGKRARRINYAIIESDSDEEGGKKRRRKKGAAAEEGEEPQAWQPPPEGASPSSSEGSPAGAVAPCIAAAVAKATNAAAVANAASVAAHNATAVAAAALARATAVTSAAQALAENEKAGARVEWMQPLLERSSANSVVPAAAAHAAAPLQYSQLAATTTGNACARATAAAGSTEASAQARPSSQTAAAAARAQGAAVVKEIMRLMEVSGAASSAVGMPLTPVPPPAPLVGDSDANVLVPMQNRAREAPSENRLRLQALLAEMGRLGSRPPPPPPPGEGAPRGESLTPWQKSVLFCQIEVYRLLDEHKFAEAQRCAVQLSNALAGAPL